MQKVQTMKPSVGKGSLARWIGSALSRFRRDEKGLIATELAVVLPVFIFSIFGVYTLWDAYRMLNTSAKAAYTVSDLLSRETRTVNDAYLTGLHNTMQYLVGDRLPVKTRFTSIIYSDARKQFEVQWSRSPFGKMPQLTTSSLQAYKDKIPNMADGDAIILVESEAHFTPMMTEFLVEKNFEEFVVTRPRFVPKLCHADVYCG